MHVTQEPFIFTATGFQVSSTFRTGCDEASCTCPQGYLSSRVCFAEFGVNVGLRYSQDQKSWIEQGNALS